MTEEDKAMQVLQGRVKWFDPAKGFGFIVSDTTNADILLHANVLRNFGQSSVADGAGVTVRIQTTARGVQAVEVLAIDPPEGHVVPLGELAGELSAADLTALPLEAARVKWFDKAKGFGFANAFGSADDIFIHIEVLRVSGFADLMSGEAVALEVIDGRRGRMAVQVLSWERANAAPVAEKPGIG